MDQDPDELKTRARRVVQELLTQGDWAIAGDIYAPGSVCRGTGEGGPTQWVLALRRAFSDLNATIEDELAEGHTVAQRLTLVGTNDGPFLGIPPTGRNAKWNLAAVFHADPGGAFTEHWAIWDRLDVLRQLGSAPGPVTNRRRATTNDAFDNDSNPIRRSMQHEQHDR